MNHFRAALSAFYFAFFLASLSPLFAQSVATPKITLSGTLRNAENGEALIKAAVAVPSLQLGTYTNEYGFYSLRIPAGKDSITVSIGYTGLRSVTLRVLPDQNREINLQLEPMQTTLDEVVITDNRAEQHLKSTQMSVATISAQEAKLLPALFGEVDIIKVLQLKPGVQNGGEGSSGIYVRGGGADQNLFLLDEATVYNPNHLFGFFSTFNSDAVKNVDLYKGAFPAQYGGRLSSVVDVKMNEGNSKRFAGSGGLGLISSRLTLEGPIGGKGDSSEGSFLISGRRTYVDVFTRMINKSNEGKLNAEGEPRTPIPDYYFYDLNAKVNYRLGKKDRLFLSGYYGNDAFGFKTNDFDFSFGWGNRTATLRWNHIFNPRLFMNTTATFSDYNYSIRNKIDVFDFTLGSGIRDYTLKTDFYYQPNDKHTVRFGAYGTYYNFTVGRTKLQVSGENGSQIADNFNVGNTLYGYGHGLYVNDDWKIDGMTEVSAGLRLSGFSYLGKNNVGGKTYWGLEPRIAVRRTLTERASLKASYSRMYQYMNLVGNSAATLPTDLWYPATSVIKPQFSDQVAAGVNFTFGDGAWILSNELFYKWLHNQVDFRDGANLFVNTNFEREFVFGKGWAYGNEVYLEKTRGNTTGWVGFTYAWNWRQFGESNGNPAINSGKAFHPRNDRRYDVSVVLIQKLQGLSFLGKFGRRSNLTAAWVYGTGNAVSFPKSYYTNFDLQGNAQFAPVYTERNAFRIPAYHRLDVGFVYKLKPRKTFESDITLSVYNAYSRLNTFFVDIRTQRATTTLPDGTKQQTVTGFKAVSVSLFPALPAITWNFKF